MHLVFIIYSTVYDDMRARKCPRALLVAISPERWRCSLLQLGNGGPLHLHTTSGPMQRAHAFCLFIHWDVAYQLFLGRTTHVLLNVVVFWNSFQVTMVPNLGVLSPDLGCKQVRWDFWGFSIFRGIFLGIFWAINIIKLIFIECTKMYDFKKYEIFDVLNNLKIKAFETYSYYSILLLNDYYFTFFLGG